MSASADLTVALSVSSFADADAAPLERLRGAANVLDNPHGRKLDEAEVAELISEADGVIAGTEPLTAGVLENASRLRAISRVGVGLDSVDLDAARRLGIEVFNTPDAVTDAAAELAVAGILALGRHLHRMDAAIRAGNWDRMMGSLMIGKTVGVVGLGRVGRRVAALLGAFGTKLIAYDVVPDDGWAAEHGVERVELGELLPRAEVVTLHASGADRLLGATELAALPDGAIVANAARGGLVDEQALHAELASGRLGGAYLDVFEQEPYDGPLRELDNVLLTAHAGSYAREARALMEAQAVENLLAYLESGAS